MITHRRRAGFGLVASESRNFVALVFGLSREETRYSISTNSNFKHQFEK